MAYAKHAVFGGCLLVLSGLLACAAVPQPPAPTKPKPQSGYAEIEAKLTPLAQPLPKPGANDWLANHKEKGQTFSQYMAARPVRRSTELTTIYICLIGEFT